MKTLKKIFTLLPDILFGNRAESATTIIVLGISAYATLIAVSIIIAQILK